MFNSTTIPGANVEIELNSNEYNFLSELFKRFREKNTSQLNITRMGDGTLNVEYYAMQIDETDVEYSKIQIGRINLCGEKTSMQILKHSLNSYDSDVFWYRNLTLEQYIDKISYWLLYALMFDIQGRENYYENYSHTSNYEDDIKIYDDHYDDNFIMRLMLDYAPKYKYKGNNDFQGFWKYRYNTKPQAILDKLENSGLIKCGSIEQSLKYATITELKPALKQYNLKLSGKKQELIDRLLDNVNEEELTNIFKSHFHYDLTEKGLEMYNEKLTKIVIYAHINQEYHIDIYKAAKYDSINEYLIDLFMPQALKYKEKKNWVAYAGIIKEIAEFYMQDNKYINAAEYYVQICYLNVMFDDNNFEYWLKHKSTYPEEYSLFVNTHPLLNPQAIYNLNTIQRFLRYSDSDFENIIIQTVNKFSLPTISLSDEEFAKLIIKEIQ